jgi:hypothetical protein
MYEKIQESSQYNGEPTFFEKTFGIIVEDNAMSMGPIPTCSESDVFAPLLKTIPVTAIDLPGELRKRGVTPINVLPIDVNLDGQQEWLVFLNSYYWRLVWQDGTNYYANRLFAQWYLYKDADIASLSARTEKWAAFSNPILIVSGPKMEGIWEVEEGFETRWLTGDELVQKFSISNTDTNPVVQYEYSLPTSDTNYSSPWVGYRWNPQTQSFDKDLIGYLLFTDRNPTAAVNLLSGVIPLLPAWEKSPKTGKWDLPRVYYIAALAYELAGDEKKAVDLYWQLWKKFPESHYARAAQFKLEPISP